MSDYVWIACRNDFGWIQDGTRELEGPLAAAFQERQIDDLGARGVGYVEVWGSVEHRVGQVIEHLGEPNGQRTVRAKVMTTT